MIKQFPQRLDIINAGGFPVGVTIENLLITPSTPRNRLLADVLQKTGIVERSGQRVDKIFYNTLSEGKSEPDYSKSDSFQVTLKLSAVINDRAFALFLDSVQKELPKNQKLSVLEILTLNKIKKGILKKDLDGEQIEKLLDKKLIEKRGKTNAIFYILSKDYYEFTDEKAKYYKFEELEDEQVLSMIMQDLAKEEIAKMKDFVHLFDGRLSRRQVRTRVERFLDNKMLDKEGEGSSTLYKTGKKYIESIDIFSEAFDIAMKKIEKKNT
ncbi:MAG: ATP-binding protein [Flavobacteriaceae bacterium]